MDTTIFYIDFPKRKNIVLGEVKKERKYLEKYIFHNKFIFMKKEGFDLLLKTVNTRPDKINELQIYNNDGKTYTIQRFLGVLENCNVR